MKIFGFTLSEVLITLGIIGIVSALTIPSLVTNYQKKQTATRLKTFYTTMSQAIKRSEAENGTFEGWEYKDNDTVKYFNTYLKPYMKAKSASKINFKNDSFRSNKVRSFMMDNGTVFFISVNSSGTWFVGVDINGNEGPNREGRDIFFFNNTTTKGFYVFGYPANKTREDLINGIPINSGVDTACCKKSGCATNWYKYYTCGALIQKDNWEIRPDYPW